MTMLVSARRGKFSPGEAGAGARLDKEARRIVPVPVTGNNLTNAARSGSVSLYDVVEGFSRPVSPTTHLHQVFVPPPPMVRKRKSISRRLLESFRESRSAEAVFKEDLLNKYVKNRLSEDMFSLNTVTNNSIISTASKVERVASKLSRRNSELKSFLINSFRGEYRQKNQTKQVDSVPGPRALVHCRYRAAGCSLRFSQTRPQLRLQHEATCRHMTVTCHWAGEDTCAAGDVSLKDIEDHLLADHGDLVAQVEQEGEEAVRLSEVIPMLHGETSWPDNLGCFGPKIIIIRALGHRFLLFLRSSEKMRDDYDLAVAILGPPQLANRYGYELRLYDEAGFAYRGPMLSAATPFNQFWTQGYNLHIPNLDVLGSFFETTVRIFYRG